ncbi:ATP-binding cassette domain-containing protein [Salipiger bermudensis]|uniref:ABC transporter ATP-binding protein/permease n=1 Tax=Salipiger bermudensis TaxID=344736 RepID=UPI001C99E460|nr:ATP-binding cassette domain-containing protein [Salipiger bermudensis]MBY6004626.1 ATP-binding cassette domain-containing protein [Salipiger bermudensis]
MTAPAEPSRLPEPPEPERRGILLALLPALTWPLQAAVIAWVLGGLLTDPAQVPALGAAAAFLALAALRAGCEALAQRVLSEAADARIVALRAEIVTREAGSADAARHGGAGAMAALAGEKLEALRPYLTRYRPARLRAMVMPLVILALALWHSWAVALILLLAGPLIPVFMALVGWAAKAASERQMVEIGALSDLLVDRLAALSDLRLIGAGGPLVTGFAEASERLRDRSIAVLRIAFLSSTVLELFSALGVAMVAIWVGFTLLGELGWGSWGAELSPAAGIFLLLLAPEFFQPLRDLAAAWHDKAGADAVLAEVEAWRAEPRAARLGQGVALPPSGPLPVLRLSGLCHHGIRYPELEISPGDTVAITGPSGAGKSTLLRLIAGLERPEEGVITLGAAPLDAASADVWRGRIGWMPQAPHFLARSLRHNIGFGASVAPEAAHLGGVLEALPRGLDTMLGERGAGLSGGEARRVTLARAMQGAPGLILADEPTADLDAQTAAAITEALLAFARRGGTLVVATHDGALAARLLRQVSLGPAAGGDA